MNDQERDEKLEEIEDLIKVIQHQINESENEQKDLRKKKTELSDEYNRLKYAEGSQYQYNPR